MKLKKNHRETTSDHWNISKSNQSTSHLYQEQASNHDELKIEKKKNLTPGFLFFPSSPGPLSSPPADRPRNWSSPTALHELSRTRSHSTGSNRGPDFFARKKPSCWAILSWPANWKAARENGHATGRYRSRPSRAGSSSSYSTSG